MDKQYSKRSQFLNTLTPGTAAALLEHAIAVHVNRGTVIFTEAEPADGLYFVISGKVKLTRASQTIIDKSGAKQSLLRLLPAGAMFGELSALDKGSRSSTATAVTNCELRHVSQESLQRVLASHPEVAGGFLRQLAARLRWADLVLSELARNDVPGRVAATLLYLSETVGIPDGESISVRHDLTQAELAAMVGATRETVNRTLTDLASRGVIENGVKKVVILDSLKLEALVN